MHTIQISYDSDENHVQVEWVNWIASVDKMECWSTHPSSLPNLLKKSGYSSSIINIQCVIIAATPVVSITTNWINFFG